ncbi:MAG TPA: hypothetical protein DCL15_09795 [Chloroflexi bacterium]|nr:hypothetical protein [Chloroflexota bacterium]
MLQFWLTLPRFAELPPTRPKLQFTPLLHTILNLYVSSNHATRVFYACTLHLRITQFGIITVDRTMQARTPKPSAHWLGAVAHANRCRFV